MIEKTGALKRRNCINIGFYYFFNCRCAYGFARGNNSNDACLNQCNIYQKAWQLFL